VVGFPTQPKDLPLLNYSVWLKGPLSQLVGIRGVFPGYDAARPESCPLTLVLVPRLRTHGVGPLLLHMASWP